MDQAADGGVLWATVINRWASLTVLAAALAVTRRRPRVPHGATAPIAAVGVLDIGADPLHAPHPLGSTSWASTTVVTG